MAEKSLASRKKHARRSASVKLAKVHLNEDEHQFHIQISGLQQVGEGASGQAFMARNELDGRMYCVKSVVLKTPDMQTAVVNEARIHAELNHDSVVKYCYSWLDQQERQTAFCMLLELCQSDLWHCLENSTPTEEERMKWSRQLADALSHIHAHSIVHRDLNPWNVLVTSSRDVKVGDFGLSVHCPSGGNLSGTDAPGAVPLDESALGSLYSAPELGGKQYNMSADIFSLGVTLFAIWDMGNHPHEKEESKQVSGDAGDAGDAGGTGEAGDAGKSGDTEKHKASGDATDASDRLYSCNECGDSASLGAIDPDDGMWYCKPCWEAFMTESNDGAEGTGDDRDNGEEKEAVKVTKLVTRIEGLRESQQLPDDFASKCPIASLVLRMVSHSPSERPSAAEVLSAILSSFPAAEQA